MKKALLLTLVVHTAVMHGQDTARFYHRWSFQVSASPEVGYRTLSDTYYSDSSPFINRYHRADGGQLGFHVDAMIARRLGTKWRLMAGIAYSDMDFRGFTYLDNLTFGDWLDPYAGIIYTTNTVPPPFISTSKHFQYLELPIEVRKEHGGGSRWHVCARYGCALAFLLKATETAKFEYTDRSPETYKIDITDTYRSFNLFASFGIGAAYHVKQGLTAYLLPTARFGILDMLPNSLIQHAWGVNLTLSIVGDQ